MLCYVSSFLLFALFLCQAWNIQADCENLTDPSGNITEFYPGPRSDRYHKCWNIVNPDNQLLEIELKHLDFEQRSCRYVNVTVTANRTGEQITWCENDSKRKLISVYSNVTIYFYVDYNELTPNKSKNLELSYNIDYSIKGIEGLREAYTLSANWLMGNASSWKWINHIPKAVTALALASNDGFGGKNLQEELMVKQRELRISVALLRDSISNEQLSTFINSILSTCHNPRNFYGHNLIKLLMEQMATENFTHPASYLALCNANQTWPDNANDQLLKIFNSKSSMPFTSDYKAFAMMALSCRLRRTGASGIRKEVMISYSDTRADFVRLQNLSGSFGNIHRTALISQALISSIYLEEIKEDWNRVKAVKFLLKSMKIPPTDFLSTYFILPVLNEKSLADIAFINCSSSRDPKDLVDEVIDYLGEKIQVQYSLFVGDSKDVIHTIILKVPDYFTALDVMQFAAVKDKKYRFKYEMVSGKLDIYEMTDIPNDPEDGKFWLFYVKKAGGENIFSSRDAGPAKTALSDGDHIAMWYKKYSGE